MAESRRACASCGAPNEEDARFCEGCGASLARICATCGVEASATARFCRGCGSPLGTKSTPNTPDAGPVRKTVTVMFADLAGSTSFEERVDAETAREVVGRYHDLLRTTAERHRAGVTKYIGDGFMAVWGVPEIGADDAARAVDAAVELQERFVGLAARVAEIHGVELALRVAVNTGEVVVGAGDADLVGDALNVGARLEAECPRGHVVVGEETWRATRGAYSYESLGQVQVKGRTAPVAVYRWLARQSGAADAAPFVGRGDEVGRLQAAMRDAVSARAARLVTVIGDPGVGKSRLAAEFTRAQPEARVVEARCVLEGTVALGPLVEVLRACDLETELPAGVPERDRLLRDLNGLASGVPGSVEESFWALRRFIEVLATSGPVVLVLDDIQWADTLLLDFIEHLVEWVKEVPVLVLALARPELRDIRSELVTVSRWTSEAIHLGGLDAGATAELAAKVLGATRLPDELLTRLPSSTGGNPLFVRELIGMLAHDGVLVEESRGWRLTIDVDAITIPPTIHALLASRLERLDAADRRVLEIASVVGSDFSLGMVRALADKGAEGIKLSLKRLRRLELAQPSGAYVGDEPVWRFHHVLIRDVAYRRLLKSDRANLHERLADWVESGGQSVAFDADEMIARHLEAAHTYRTELGTVDEHTSDLALRSARHYATSARRALDRDELVSAGTQAARGAAVAAADEALHAELLLIGCEAYLSAGDVAAGAPLVDDLDRIADDSLAPWATCYRCQFVIYTEPERLPEVDTRLQGAIDEFSRRKDPAGLAKAHRVRASARSRLGRIGDCEADLFEALIAARQSGDHRQITAALGAAPGAALWGPSPVPKAGGRCLDVVRMQRMTTAAPSLEATSLRHLAVLELLRGRPDKARKMLADARQVVADLGLRHGLMETELFAGLIESMEGDPVAAEPHFRTALEGLDALGVGADAGQAAALLARSVLAQGRLDEADRYAAESERLAGRNLKTAIAWRAVRAEISASQGLYDDATAMAREAVTVAAGTDLVLDHADACLALSRVLDAVGDTKGAASARANAEALYTAKEVAAKNSRVAAPATPTVATSAPAAGPTTSRLAVTNRASQTSDVLGIASIASDVDAAVACYADSFVFDDRRQISGDPIYTTGELRAATERLFVHYKYFEWRTLAIRGERLHLSWSECSDDAGNTSAYLHVRQIGNDGRFTYDARFDEDDFQAAYRELDRRYFGGEGAAFAEAGLTVTQWTLAVNRGDFDTLFDELTTVDFRIENRSRSAFPDRSALEYRATLEELAAMVVSARAWISVMSWVSPNWCVVRCERDALGEQGEHYTWHFLIAFELREGLVASMCEFEVDDEEGAFAYAEERVRASTSRLRISNRASEIAEAASQALRAHDVSALRVDPSHHFVYDDRRRFSGDPISDGAELQAATERILESYPHSAWRTIAVRGERLEMHWSRLWDDAGNEATTFDVMEFDDVGRLEYFGRFEEDDFESAYRELDRRYYAGEGAAFAEAGALTTEWIVALNRGDYATAFGELSDSDAGYENRSRSAFPDPSVSDPAASYEDLTAPVGSTRTWPSAFRWLSPKLVVSRLDREAIGHDGEQYSWTWILVSEPRNGRFGIACLFELDDEDAAFAYAEERMRAQLSRLGVTNQSSEITDGFFRAMKAHDVEGAIACYPDQFVYEDHRRLSGDPIVGREAMRDGIARMLAQYPQYKFDVLAVRGQRLHLVRSCASDTDGNMSSGLTVFETGDGLITYHGRFDEDDLDGAYRELQRRYYSSDGAAFARSGATATESIIALNSNDFDLLLGELSTPDMRVENRTRSAFPDRSITDLRTSFGELNSMVTSIRTWLSSECWVSPEWAVVRLERDAVGDGGEQYSWTRLLVIGFRGGQMASMCQFELEDEDAAFAVAEERMRAVSSRIAVANPSVQSADRLGAAMNAHDIDAIMRCISDQLVYDDRRRLTGDPISGHAEFRAAFERILAQYSHFERSVLAVRGNRLNLHRGRWSDDSGNETAYLHVYEMDDDGLQIYEGRFDEDDFENAYRELENRYMAGEGAAFAESVELSTHWVTALNRGELDRMLSELSSPGMRFESRSRSAFPDRSAADLRESLQELDAMVTSVRTWNSAVRWVSPAWVVARMERDAVGPDGERYEWTRIYVGEYGGGRLMSLCEFEVEDEEAAFAYAEEQLRATVSRLPVTNRASRAAEAAFEAMKAFDIDRTASYLSEHLVFDDRRRLAGNPFPGVRFALERVFEQYTEFEGRVLAVRGERLTLGWTLWRNDSGFETAYLVLYELGDDGRFAYQGRFDEDDFEGAYRELERRYYTGEGAPFAEAGGPASEFVVALHRGDLDRLFRELAVPGLRIENRSRSVFGDRSEAEFRASFDELNAIVVTSRVWESAVCWLSPTVLLARFEREAVGRDGEHYAWSHLHVNEIRGGQLTSACLFELEDEDAAFAYAEELVRTPVSRLDVSNRASRVWRSVGGAMRTRDVDRAVAHFSDSLVYDDRWPLGGDPPKDIRAAMERVLQQYSHFESRILAVRGDTLQLATAHWSNDDGYETDYLNVTQIDDEGRISYYGRFDEDDFETAYRELQRRYCAGEGASFAAGITPGTEWLIAANNGDFDKVFGELSDPGIRIENRSRSGFPDRTATELRASFDGLNAMVASARMWNSIEHWLSPAVVVGRQEREAVGPDGEQYAWTRLFVFEAEGGRATGMCEFEVDDEAGAFAYAEDRVLQAQQR